LIWGRILVSHCFGVLVSGYLLIYAQRDPKQGTTL
jgi:hypothetical protein